MIFADLTIKGTGGVELCTTLKANLGTQNIPLPSVRRSRYRRESPNLRRADAPPGPPVKKYGEELAKA